MSNRCPDCGIFVSLEQADPEVDSLEIDDGGHITGEVRIVLACAECGTEMKETTIQIDTEPSQELADHIQSHKDAGDEYILFIEDSGVEATDRMQTVDRHGKPIKNYRYMRHFYGFTLTVTVTCGCDSEFEIELEDDEQASAFEDLN